MDYDKGPQLTVRMLKEYLNHIPDDTKVRIGIGDENAPAHYLLNYGGELLLQTDCYMQNAAKTNLTTVLCFIKSKSKK